MDKQPKTPPTYAIASVDHALRIAAMLQLEGPLTVSAIADRLGVARSTAHRLLAMLVYRDFAIRDDHHAYHAGPVLELATLSRSHTSSLRSAALPIMVELSERLDESVNLCVRTGDAVRFIASVEPAQTLRVGSREGMVFPAHTTTAGLLLLAELSTEELESIYAADRYVDSVAVRPDLKRLRLELGRIRRSGFVVNRERAERGIVAIGVAVRAPTGAAIAGLAVSMPSMRYQTDRLVTIVATLRSAARDIEAAVPSTASGIGRIVRE